MLESASSPVRDKRGTLAVAGEALAFAFGFLARNPAAIVRRLAGPCLLGGLALYVLIWGYCAQLVDYLHSPSEGLAGRVMGMAAVSVMIMLLLHAIVVSRLAEMVMDGRADEPHFLGGQSRSWRIYAANLRLLLGLGLYGLAMFGASTLLVRLGITPDTVRAFDIVAWLLLFWLLARAWFFLVPASLSANGEGGLGMSWRSSEGHLPVIASVMLVLAMVMLFLLMVGEFLTRLVGALSSVPASLTLFSAIGFYQSNLWPFVVLVSVAYVLSVSLMTAACIRLYQELIVSPPA